eukprot:CAMPEP_0172322272 /NCGR_PEP_ID=MMETSP1058-20130122/45463_1 /TAXON_ID=83371 /ORGANISM="Detonula confervacea, Strain CCMP 353" /LENGTH=510 /DNA_ID=CAMNT_0013037975 /DNA_START=33 /DNA_END=1565 /DNA_ORIENTATION=-
MTAGSPTMHSFTTGAGGAPPAAAAAIALSTTTPRSKATKIKRANKRSAPHADHLDTANNYNYYHRHAWSNKKARNSSKTNNDDSNRQPSFPTVLMGIMSAPQNAEYITYLSDESSIIIINPEAVAKNVLPIHFEDTILTYDQFLYLLTMWGFEVVKDPQFPKVKVYKHPMFRKGDWEACLQMKLPQEEVNRSNIQAMDTSSPTTQHGDAHISRAEQPKPPSPHQRQLSFDSGAGSGWSSSQSPSMKARSVTPPENIILPSSGLLPYQAISQSLSQESASQWMMQSAMLEQMIMATAETRRRLSAASAAGSFSMDDMSLEELQNMYHQGTRNSSARGYPNLEAHTTSSASMIPRSMGRMPPTTCSSSVTPRSMGRMSPSSSFAQEGKGPSDTQLQWMTSNVVSAAIAALQGSKQRQQSQSPVEMLRNIMNHSMPSRSNTIGISSSSSSSSSSLDAMTEAFLKRSLARRMLSRPPGILGSAPPLSKLATTFYNPVSSDMIHAQARALLHARQ